jgi:hypothetical protein
MASTQHQPFNISLDFSGPLQEEREGRATETRLLKADILFNVIMNLLMAGSVVTLCAVPFLFPFVSH